MQITLYDLDTDQKEFALSTISYGIDTACYRFTGKNNNLFKTCGHCHYTKVCRSFRNCKRTLEISIGEDNDYV